MKGYWFYTLICPILVVLDVLIEVELPLITGDIIDALGSLEGGGTFADVAQQIVKMMLYTIATLAVGIAANICSSKASMGFGSNARRALFDKIQEFSFDNVDKFSSTSLITRLTRDINSIQTVFGSFLVSMIKGPIMVVSTLIYALEICKGTNISLVFVYSVPALLIVLLGMGILVVPLVKKLLEKIDRFNSSVRENANGIRVVKTFVREDSEREKFNLANDDILKWNIKVQNLLLFVTPFVMIIMYACMIITMWNGSNAIIDNFVKPAAEFNLTPGKLFSLVSYVMSVLTSLMSVLMIFVTIITARASINRVKEVMNEEPSINDSLADKSLEVPDGSIEFKDVCFRYSKKAAKPILENINLYIRSGETLGIIGGTGSGKSTLVQLIPRLYDAESGEINVGGYPLSNYTLYNLRESVAMVLQQNTLFSGTIRDNIRWGRNDATDEEIERVCEAAQADEFIKGFVDGYDTSLGSDGVNLSGGQKQRLCIARALLKKPKILIFDDSTSAVDTQTETSIRAALASDEFEGITKIIIAQRITSVMEADRIAIIDNGHIDAVGTHEELMKGNRIYQEIYTSQQEGVLA